MVEAETDNCNSPVTPITDEWFSYDIDGNVTDMWELTPHSGTYYHSIATFAGNGAILTLQLANPSLYTLTYGLDGEGRWNTLKSGTQNFVTGPASMYNAAGQLAEIDLVGSDKDLYTYDPNTGRMKTWEFVVGSANQSGTLSWNANGTLNNLSITDGFNAAGTQNCNYNPSVAPGTGYDDLGRLVGADCGTGGWGQTFSYDQYDNLTKSVISGRTGIAWNPGYSSANNHYALAGTSYDNSGNLLTDTFHTYSWDPFNKLASVDSSTCGTNGECVTYDALGRAVETSLNTNYTEIWYTQLGKTVYMSGSTRKYAHVPAPGGGTLDIPGSYYYVHKDWLGNARIVSTINNHTVDADQAYAPYGEMYDLFGSMPQFQMFTGDTQDIVATGDCCFDTPNRELSANQGRWISPDPARAGWNQYAYVNNMPLTNVDPLGLWCTPEELKLLNKTSGDCPGNGGLPLGWNWNEFALMDIPVTTRTYTPATPPQPVFTPIAPMNNEFGEAVSFRMYIPAIPGGWSTTVIGNGFGLFGGGGLAFAANNGNPQTPQQPNKTGCGLAITQGAISLGLDVVGAIPAFGNVVSATAAGARAVNGIVAYGGAAYGIATGLPDESPVGAAGAGAGLGLTLADTALEGGKVIPVLGNFLSAGIGLYDGYQLAKTIGKCW